MHVYAFVKHGKELSVTGAGDRSYYVYSKRGLTVIADEFVTVYCVVAAYIYNSFSFCSILLLCVCKAIDGDIVMLSANWERRRTALTQLQEQLQSLPAFISELDAITTNIGKKSVSFLDNKGRQHHH